MTEENKLTEKDLELKWKFLKLNGVINRKYKVSNYGDVVLAKGMVPLVQRDMYKKCVSNGTDYKSVTIQGVKSAVRVHRIVCETFKGKAPTGRFIVDHIDERKNNNRVDNLEWVSPKQNTKAYYSKHSSIRHPLKTIKTVKRLVNRGWTNDRIAQKVNMSDSNVSSIKLGRIHASVEPYTLEQWL